MEAAGRGWDLGGAGRLTSVVAAVCILKVYAIVTHSLKTCFRSVNHEG